jgi:hypothetical protein
VILILIDIFREAFYKNVKITNYLFQHYSVLLQIDLKIHLKVLMTNEFLIQFVIKNWIVLKR